MAQRTCKRCVRCFQFSAGHFRPTLKSYKINIRL